MRYIIIGLYFLGSYLGSLFFYQRKGVIKVARKRNSKPASKIKLTKEEFAKWHDTISNWMVNVAYHFLKNSPSLIKIINDKNKREVYISDKIKECEIGWTNNSDEFRKRIKVKFNFDALKPNHYYDKSTKKWMCIDDLKSGKLDSNQKNEVLEILEAGNNIGDMKDIYEEIIDSGDFQLTEDEIKKTYHRIQKLFSTFQFNDANDRDSIRTLCFENIRYDRLMREFLNADVTNYNTNMNNAIKDCLNNIKNIQDILGISAKNRREHENNEMTATEIIEEYSKSVEDYKTTVEYALEEMIVLVRAYQSGKVHPNNFKYIYGLTIDEIFEMIDAHYIILDDDGKPMKPTEFKKYVEVKASRLARKCLKDYGLDMEETN